jgi:hypothetical protein
MSKISDHIRACVDDTSVSDHYGEWGILNPRQRILIRNLCDVCDMYEKTADLAVAERAANVAGFIEQIAKIKRDTAKEILNEFAEDVKLVFYKEFDEIIPSIMADKIDELKKEYLEKKQ